nr:MFS transporter [Desulfobulbus sp.]
MRPTSTDTTPFRNDPTVFRFLPEPGYTFHGTKKRDIGDHDSADGLHRPIHGPVHADLDRHGPALSGPGTRSFGHADRSDRAVLYPVPGHHVHAALRPPGDIVGQRIMFLMGLVVFTLFTLFLGHATSILTVIVLRFFQGLGSSMVLSGSMALVAAAYPPLQRASKIGLVSACTYVGLSTGPVIGSYVTLHFSWRHIFLMPVPIGIAAILTCLFGMKEMEKNAQASGWIGRGAWSTRSASAAS